MNIINSFNFSNMQMGYSHYKLNSPSFAAKTPTKLLNKILETKNVKTLKISFDEMVKVYNHLGYDVLMKRGSHAIVPVGDIKIPLPIPHKDKVVHANDIKRLKYIVAGEVEKAKYV